MRERPARFPPAAAALFVVLLLLPGTAWSIPPFEAEQATMMTTVTAFNHLAELIESAQTVEQMTRALRTAADQLEKVLPPMIEVTKSHPNWGENAPAEVQETMSLFNNAAERFLGSALRRAVEFTNEHPNDPELKHAFSRLNQLLYRL
ncbi:hypothetical protein [Salinispira pacifica]